MEKCSEASLRMKFRRNGLAPPAILYRLIHPVDKRVAIASIMVLQVDFRICVRRFYCIILKISN